MLCKSCSRALLIGTGSRGLGATSRRYASSALSKPLKLAIIGAGPSGFYAASRILSSIPADSPNGRNVQVDMYERLPTPYGLARYGVAPDHPEVKNCQHKFDELANDPRFNFIGNVSVGTQPSASTSETSPSTSLSAYTYPHAVHLPLGALLPYYSTVLLTYGSSLSNPLSSVSGSSSSTAPLQGVYPALALVGWYNGHPAFSHLAPDLSSVRSVSVIGHGNVALDVSRILLKPVEQLRETDMPESVLEVLAASKVERVMATGRRGPAQVAFTTKEFREMIKLPRVHYTGLDQALAEDAKAAVEGDRMRTRLLGLMEKDNGVTAENAKRFQLEFLRSPSAFKGEGGRVKQVEWNVNELLSSSPAPPTPPSSQAESQPKASVVARPTGEKVVTEANMVVESVGYRSEPLGVGEAWVLPFDRARGRVRNVGGRVVDEAGVAVSGLYAAGWAARGPVGVIASTMHDAYALSDLILDDHYAESTSTGRVQDGIPDELVRGRKEGKVVDLAGWGKIDAAERENAKRRGLAKEREKFTRVEDMLAVL